MKKRHFTFSSFLFLFVIIIMGFTENTKFYYSFKEKKFLKTIDNKLIVRYKNNKKSDKKLISLFSELKSKQFDWSDDSTCIITFNSNEKENMMQKIKNQEDVKTCNTIYATNTGLEIGITDEFYVYFFTIMLQKRKLKNCIKNTR